MQQSLFLSLARSSTTIWRNTHPWKSVLIQDPFLQNVQGGAFLFWDDLSGKCQDKNPITMTCFFLFSLVSEMKIAFERYVREDIEPDQNVWQQGSKWYIFWENMHQKFKCWVGEGIWGQREILASFSGVKNPFFGLPYDQNFGPPLLIVNKTFCLLLSYFFLFWTIDLHSSWFFCV